MFWKIILALLGGIVVGIVIDRLFILPSEETHNRELDNKL